MPNIEGRMRFDYWCGQAKINKIKLEPLINKEILKLNQAAKKERERHCSYCNAEVNKSWVKYNKKEKYQLVNARMISKFQISSIICETCYSKKSKVKGGLSIPGAGGGALSVSDD